MFQTDLKNVILFDWSLKQKSFDSDSIHESIQNHLQACLHSPVATPNG